MTPGLRPKAVNWSQIEPARTATDDAGNAKAPCPTKPGQSANPFQQPVREELGTPVIWIPHSYAGCHQHGPDEHGLGSLLREGLGLMAGLYWDIGEGLPAV